MRVVVVSPGDVARERLVAQTVIDELNRGVAADRGCWLSLWRWEQVASQLLRRIFAAALGRAGRWNWREHPDIICAHRTYLALARRDSLALG